MSRGVRTVVIVVLIAIAIVVLFNWVFPWVERLQQDPTIGVTQLLRSAR